MKKVLILLSIIILIILIYFVSRDSFIKDKNNLYNEALKYIANEQMNTGYDKDKNKYHVFTDYKGFGITKKYIYMWILEESYYVEDNKIISSEGSSMPYRFTYKNGKIIHYDIPKDGTEYEKSIKELFPNSIENKVLEYQMDNNKIKEEIDKYYSYLKK